MGLIGDYYFLNEVTIDSKGTTINMPEYSMEIQEKGIIRIINLLSDKNNPIDSNPHDGKLDVLISTKKRDQSLIRLDKLEIISQNNITVDGVIEIKSPANISVAKNKLNVIVGKDRCFQ